MWCRPRQYLCCHDVEYAFLQQIVVRLGVEGALVGRHIVVDLIQLVHPSLLDIILMSFDRHSQVAETLGNEVFTFLAVMLLRCA